MNFTKRGFNWNDFGFKPVSWLHFVSFKHVWEFIEGEQCVRHEEVIKMLRGCKSSFNGLISSNLKSDIRKTKTKIETRKAEQER